MIEVLDATDRHRLPTGRVIVRAPQGASDAELAAAAGYTPSHHWGYNVTRYPDGTALVSLWND